MFSAPRKCIRVRTWSSAQRKGIWAIVNATQTSVVRCFKVPRVEDPVRTTGVSQHGTMFWLEATRARKLAGQDSRTVGKITISQILLGTRTRVDLPSPSSWGGKGNDQRAKHVRLLLAALLPAITQDNRTDTKNPVFKTRSAQEQELLLLCLSQQGAAGD
jgi:hypothetical protein